ncbi:MAG: hypothetical protein U0401_16665 [Anaerolineae bacterium]
MTKRLFWMFSLLVVVAMVKQRLYRSATGCSSRRETAEKPAAEENRHGRKTAIEAPAEAAATEAPAAGGNDLLPRLWPMARSAFQPTPTMPPNHCSNRMAALKALILM